MSNFRKVEEFHVAVGQPTEKEAVWPDDTSRKLRYALIEEELAELNEALEAKDIVGVADALTDLLYVVYGAGHTFGIDLDATFAEVHRSNMTKTVDGKVIRREDGKILKPDTYEPPNLWNIVLCPKT